MIVSWMCYFHGNVYFDTCLWTLQNCLIMWYLFIASTRCSSMCVEWYFTWIKSWQPPHVSVRYFLSSPHSGAGDGSTENRGLLSLYWLTFWHFKIESRRIWWIRWTQGLLYSILKCPLTYWNVLDTIGHFYPLQNPRSYNISRSRYWWPSSSIHSESRVVQMFLQ